MNRSLSLHAVREELRSKLLPVSRKYPLSDILRLFWRLEQRQGGIPARKIADELRLPVEAPLDEPLGQLRKSYSFTMQEVRDVVARLIKDSNDH